MKMKNIAGLLLVLLLAGCGAADIYYDNEQIASRADTFFLHRTSQNINGTQFHAKVGSMTGMGTVWSYNSDRDKTLSVSYTVRVHSGKLKLVLITPDNRLTTLAEWTAEMEETANVILNVQKYENRMKIVAAEKTKFEIDLSASEGSFQTIGDS